MKAKYTILMIAPGYCLDFAGGLQKIMHYSRSNNVLVTARVLKVPRGIVAGL